MDVLVVETQMLRLVLENVCVRLLMRIRELEELLTVNVPITVLILEVGIANVIMDILTQILIQLCLIVSNVL